MFVKIVKSKIIKKINAWLPVLVWALLIFHFSSGIVPIVSIVHWQDFLIKKTGHVILFGTLAVLIFRGLRIEKINRKKAAVWSIILAAVYGATDEYHQMFTLGREPHVRDIFIDLIGASLIILAVYKIVPRLSKNIYMLFEKLNLT